MTKEDRPRGGRALSSGGILVVIDTLCFSPAAATAVHHGVLSSPCPPDEALFPTLTRRVGGEVALEQHYSSTPPTRFTLSPCSYLAIDPDMRAVLFSPNGATCCQYGNCTPVLLVGTRVNAQAVAEAASSLLSPSGVVPQCCTGGSRREEPV